jgi:hypothetical protein
MSRSPNHNNTSRNIPHDDDEVTVKYASLRTLEDECIAYADAVDDCEHDHSPIEGDYGRVHILASRVKRAWVESEADNALFEAENALLKAEIEQLKLKNGKAEADTKRERREKEAVMSVMDFAWRTRLSDVSCKRPRGTRGVKRRRRKKPSLPK